MLEFFEVLADGVEECGVYLSDEDAWRIRVRVVKSVLQLVKRESRKGEGFAVGLREVDNSVIDLYAISPLRYPPHAVQERPGQQELLEVAGERKRLVGNRPLNRLRVLLLLDGVFKQEV